MTSPFDALAQLGRLMAEQAEALGLVQASWVPIVDLEGSQHGFQAVYVLPDPLGEPEEDEGVTVVTPYDDDLAGIMEATEAAEAEAAETERQQLHELQQAALEEKMQERAQRAMEMRERLRDPKRGFLDD